MEGKDELRTLVLFGKERGTYDVTRLWGSHGVGEENCPLPNV